MKQRPTADHEGFTDSTGARMDYERGLEEAARCVMRQGEDEFIVELLRKLSPDEILPWIVYPDTGEFAA